MFLWLGFGLSGISWWNILNKHKVVVSVNQAIISHGLAVFTKYIPGKIWSIIGRAGYIARLSYPLKTTAFFSLKEQVIYIWEGLIISVIPMLIIYGFSLYVLLVVILSVFITFLLFFRSFHDWFIKIFWKITKRELDVPFLKFTVSIKIIYFVFLYWVVWLFAFYLFVISFYENANIHVAFAFSLSVTVGLLAIIFPAGLGVREGVMGSYLIMTGIPLEISTVIVVYARIWFFSGEVFIFTLALLLRLVKKFSSLRS
jgi:uncharacterized membrane protein YbhN (UPF0104 family)